MKLTTVTSVSRVNLLMNAVSFQSREVITSQERWLDPPLVQMMTYIPGLCRPEKDKSNSSLERKQFQMKRNGMRFSIISLQNYI